MQRVIKQILTKLPFKGEESRRKPVGGVKLSSQSLYFVILAQAGIQ